VAGWTHDWATAAHSVGALEAATLGDTMTISENGAVPGGNGSAAIGLTDTASFYYREIDSGQRKRIHDLGRRFTELTGGSPCLVLIGRLIGPGDPGASTERRVQRVCQERFGFPKSPPEETINVILDSTGGPLDSAFRTVLYLRRYAENLNIYVPRKAKSASTLIAIGGTKIIMSPFGELGPLDTQIRDPRNPTDYISALDCYQSVDYVREFGFSTLSQALKQLAAVTQGKLLLTDSLDAAAKFAIGSITPMLSQTRSLDFGAWGRSLKMGERYAQILIARGGQVEQGKSERIASRLVYGYTHHLFPIDITEATDIGLDPQEMSEETYNNAIEIVRTCDDSQVCVEFADEYEKMPQRNGGAAAGSVPETAGSESAGPEPEAKGAAAGVASGNSGTPESR
jgi:Serine dehydrogenase proteinase